MNTSLKRALGTTALTAAAVLAGTGIASAHVVVNAPGAAQGGYSVLEFRVPTESETASTTAVTVELPGLASARTEPIPGWTATTEKDSGDLVTSVTWTANPGAGIPPGEFQRFAISAGPLPAQDEVEFPATQTYSDGSVVDWNQTTPAGGKEPEHPSPTLELAVGSDDGVASPAAASSSSDTDTTARWLGGVGLVLGALGAALGIGATVRSRRS
ncbi:YcnI family protein [Actinomycetes bacterium M1A6_2h]